MATAGYSGTPLPRKLGIKKNATVAVIGDPGTFVTALGELPAGAALRTGNRGKRELTVWFLTSRNELGTKAAAIERAAAQGPVWLAWPKKASPIRSDLTEQDLRDELLPLGLVDTKVCAIDDDWSGLRFSRRKS